MHGHKRQHDVDVGPGRIADLIMALEIIKAITVAAGIVADRRLYLTADRASVVEDGDPAAASLLATPGWVIPVEECERLGITAGDGMVVLPRAAAPYEPPNPLEGVNFASDQAAEAAITAGLVAADFVKAPANGKGYTKAEVQDVIDAKKA